MVTLIQNRIMKNKTSLLLALIFMSTAFISEAFASKKQALKMGYIEFAPAYFTGNDGVPTGPIIQLAKDITDEANYNLQLESFPTNRLVKYIKSGKIDIWLGVKTLPGFSEHAHLGTTALRTLRLTMYSTKKVKKVSSVKDFQGLKVIILRGYSYGGWTKKIKDPENKIDYHETKSHVSAFEMLKDGRADVLLDYRSPAELALSKVKIEGIKRQSVSNIHCYVVVSKKTPNGKKVLEDLEQAFIKLNKNKDNNYMKW